MVSVRCLIAAGLLSSLPLAGLAERQQIGRLPENPDAEVAISGLSWEPQGDALALTVEVDGATRSLGSYPKAVIFPALMYAADGRPYVVSLENAPPLYDRKVLLHPVLQDTALGCRILQLDQLIGELVEADPELGAAVEKAEAAIDAEHSLYAVAWAIRVLVGLDGIQSDYLGASALTRADGWISARQSFGTAQSIFSQADVIIEDHWSALQELKSRGGLRLLFSEPYYYDVGVTSAASACLSTVATPATLPACLTAEARGQLDTFLYDPTLRWAAPIPNYEVAYGLNELPYRLEPGLDAVLASDDGSRVSFVAWVAFTSPPSHLTGDPEPWYSARNETVLTYQDPDPFMLDTLEGPLNESANEFLGRNSYWQTSRQMLGAFTTLQRFFRLAFEEYFGPEFPIEALSRLGAETAGAAFGNNTRTPRWLTQPGRIEFEIYRTAADINALSDKVGAFQPFVDHADSCFRTIDSLIESHAPGESIRRTLSEASGKVWSETCNVEPLLDQFPRLRGRPEGLSDDEYALQRQVLLMVRLGYARRMREELAVARFDGFDIRGEVCPTP